VECRVALVVMAVVAGIGVRGAQQPPPGHSLLLTPDAPEMNQRAPDTFGVRLETSRGAIVMDARRAWGPRGADRFYNLVRAGYYDGNRFFRVIAPRWAQFGINGDPAIATRWRDRPFRDDPPVGQSNVRGTVAYAFAVPNGRTTQVFINLQDNSATHDQEPFVPFARVTEGMAAADALNAEYGESAGSGIRSGKQGPLFEGGNAYLAREFPRLDYIVRATIVAAPHSGKAQEQVSRSRPPIALAGPRPPVIGTHGRTLGACPRGLVAARVAPHASAAPRILARSSGDFLITPRANPSPVIPG